MGHRRIRLGPDYVGPDGLSKMPSYAATMTLEQLADVVAYLKSLGGGDMAHDPHSQHDTGGMKMGGSMKTH